jgi:hypothetical protein
LVLNDIGKIAERISRLNSRIFRDSAQAIGSAADVGFQILLFKTTIIIPDNCQQHRTDQGGVNSAIAAKEIGSCARNDLNCRIVFILFLHLYFNSITYGLVTLCESGTIR